MQKIFNWEQCLEITQVFDMYVYFISHGFCSVLTSKHLAFSILANCSFHDVNNTSEIVYRIPYKQETKVELSLQAQLSSLYLKQIEN